LLSLTGPLGGVTAADKLSLAVLHLMVGLPLILVLPAALPARRPAIAQRLKSLEAH
jgi:hypothetical protein